MRPHPDAIALVAFLVPLGAARAEAADAAKEKDREPALFDMGTMGKSKEPITIDSDTLEYDYKNNIVVYRGDVHAAQGPTKIRSDTLRVTLEKTTNDQPPAPSASPTTTTPFPDPPEKGQQKIHDVVALGNVRIDQGTRWATGGKAVFDQSTRTMVLTETPVLHDGPNEVAGDKVVVYLDENRSVVEGGRKRVKAVLYPAKGGGLAGDKPAPDAEKPAAAHEGSETTATAAAPAASARP